MCNRAPYWPYFLLILEVWNFGTAICSDPHFQHISKQQMLAPHPLIRVLAATSSCGQVQGYCNIDAHNTNCLLPHFIRLLVQLHQFRLSTENQLNQPLCGITRASHPLRLHLQVAVHGEIEWNWRHLWSVNWSKVLPKTTSGLPWLIPKYSNHFFIFFHIIYIFILISYFNMSAQTPKRSNQPIFAYAFLEARLASREPVAWWLKCHGTTRNNSEQLGTTQDFRPFWTSKMGNIS